MKIKSTKENNIMPEVAGVKVKDLDVSPSVDTIEPEVTPAEEVTEPTSEENKDQPNANNIPVPDLSGLFNNMFTQPTTDQPIPETTPIEEQVNEYRKVATARLIGYETGTTIYRFDIFNKEYSKDNGIIELRNVINGFNSIRPTNKKDYKDFFAMFGIITWNFNSVVMPYEKNILALITELESLINEHINIAGIKKDKFVFRIDIVEEYKSQY